ncbi:MAG: peptide deformylase [Candidatus Latescibacteria bacterium 4484_7]|nr:MAG: peptide deformylase [Candidatus Latescibacteria bacterium 4484_7]RKZ08438.1 MAG: peptide deformylase [bacterium]
MSKLALSIYGDKVLREKGEEVDDFGEKIRYFFDNMVETMIVEGGVGLAAPQVGVSRRIAVVNPEPENEKTLIRMANPRIIATSDETETMEEGCLSIPGIRGDVIRSRAIEVLYQDEEGKEYKLEAEGLLARIIQHEIDHLNGVLFIDHLSTAKKLLIKPKLRKLREGR